MNTLALSAIVLCLCLGFIHGQDKCLEPGAELINDQKAKLCYKANQASIVQLKCDWENFRFDLTVTPDKSAKPSRPPVVEWKEVGYMSPSMGRANMETATGNKACPLSGISAYNNVTSYKAPDVRLSIVNGQVDYTTTVVIAEYYYIGDNCEKQLFYITDIKLSCCADPERTPDEPIVPPLHQYCVLGDCKASSPDFDCICRWGPGDQWEIRATNNGDFETLGDNIGWYWHSLNTYSSFAGAKSTNFPLIVNGELVDLHDHLEASVQPDYSLAVNPFVFHDDHFNGVNISCKFAYCVNDRSQPVAPYLSYLPDCAPWKSR